MNSKKKLLFLFIGPIYSLPPQSKYEALSKYYSGAIITSAIDKNIKNLKEFCGFDFIAITYNYGRSIPFIRVRLKMFHKVRYFLTALIYGLRCKMKNKPIDLIITPDPIRTGLMGVMLSRLLNAKLAVEVNGVHTSPDVFADLKNSFFKKFKSWLYPTIENFVLKNTDTIKTLFPTQLAPFSETIAGKKVHCFQEFVSVKHFLGLTVEEKKEILFVGHPFYLKGVDLLIEAFKKIAPDFPQWKLNLLGHFPDKEALEKHVSGHPQIVVSKPVLYSEMPQQICSCAIFVLPSRTEAMGRVLVEAMAAGKARVGSDVDGIPTVINDGVDGFLFKKNDSQDLANKLKLLMENPDLRKALGTAGRARVLNEFTEQNYIDKLVKMYSEVLS
jgi:glycosyltransferase involved in cell wall biosynthesis